MFTKTRFLICCFLSIFTISIAAEHSHGQDKLFVKAGFGIPELLNAGLRYQFKQFQFGLYFGGYPENSYPMLTITGDMAYHFSGESKFSSRKPWFVKSGITFIRNESDNYITKEGYLNIRIGKDFNLSKRFGIELDFGTSFHIFYNKSRKEPSDDWLDSGTDEIMIYGIGVGLYYNIF